MPTQSVPRDGVWDWRLLVVRCAALEPRAGTAETREAAMAALLFADLDGGPLSPNVM